MFTDQAAVYESAENTDWKINQLIQQFLKPKFFCIIFFL